MGAGNLSRRPGRPRQRASIGLRLVEALGLFWYRRGYLAEGRRWLQRAMELTAEDGGAPLARVAHWLGVLLEQQGEIRTSLALFERSLAIWRVLGDQDQQARELDSLGITHHHLGDLDAARSLLEESAAIAREIGSDARLAAALTNLGQAESDAGNFDRAIQVLREALALDQQQGDKLGVALDQQSLAGVSLRAGRAGEALGLLSGMFDYVASCGDAELLASTLELSAAITAELGAGLRAARLAGAAEAVRHKVGAPERQPELLERFLAPARATITPEEWAGRAAPPAARSLSRKRSRSLSHPARHSASPPDTRSGGVTGRSPRPPWRFCQLGAASSAATAISASAGAGSATGTAGIVGSSPADS